MAINKRIKEYIDRHGLKVTAFATRANLRHSTISSIINNPEGNPSKRTIDAILLAYKDIDRDWLLYGDTPKNNSEEREVDEISSKTYQKLRMSLNENRKLVPMYNTKAAAGTIALVQDEPELILEFVDMPFVGMVDGAIEVVGDSMSPSFKNGARAAVRRLEDKTLLNWGEVYYIIDSNYEGYIKRVYEGVDDSHIFLRSDNPDKEMYPAFKRKWENIVAIFKVKADITKH